MKVAVIAANGKSGSLIVKEAVAKGFDVTAIVRHENKTEAQHVVQKDLFDLTREDLVGFDAVVDAFAVWDPDKLEEHQTSVEHVVNILAGTDVRVYFVGGAGSLFTDTTQTTQLKDAPDFPDAYKPVAENMSKGLAVLRGVTDVHWVYVSPANIFDPEGPKTGNYAVAGEVFTTNDKGESFISYADFAAALVDELANPIAVKERISVYTK